MNRFVLRQIFCLLGLPGWPGKTRLHGKFSARLAGILGSRHRDNGLDNGLSANRAGPVVK